MISSDIISAVRSKANILEVVSQVVVLKKMGKDYKGLCPFHKEKTPSFYVNPDKGIYKCFGCGEGGDVFTFMQKARGLGFLDGVKELAHQFGVSIIESEEEKVEYKRRSLFLLLYEQACEFYSKLLNDPVQGLAARQYLNQRGIDEETIRKFRLGLAPSAWDALIDYLCTSNKVSAASLEEAGLARRRTEGHGFFDLFRNRLIIPITDEQGRVIAFGGRTLGNDQVKYLNSPETLIYKKGEHLFALFQAKEKIRAQDAVIVVEGYFDAITAHLSGFNNTVATLGTALSSEQARLLVRHTESKKVYLAFDADSAGIRATEKGAQTLEQLAAGIGLQLKIVSIPGGKDPDECLRSLEGPDLFKRALEESKGLIEYELNQAVKGCDYKTAEGRIEIANKVVPILSKIENAVARSEYIRQIASAFGIQEASLGSDVSRQRKNKTGQSGSGMGVSKKARTAPPDGLIDAERWILSTFLTDDKSYEIAAQCISPDELMTTSHHRIINTIHGLKDQFNGTRDLEKKLFDCYVSEPEISAALVEIVLKAEEIEKQKIPVNVLLLQSRVKLIKEKLAILTKKVSSRLSSNNDMCETNLLQSKISELSRLERLTLPTIQKMEEVDEVRKKIKEIQSSLSNSTEKVLEP